jgi:putative colanic acid biosynthesis acetyltransferase WcaF
MFSRTRNLILRFFGADVSLKCLIYPSSKIWAPWNLKIGKYSCIGPNTELYNKAPIVIGENAIVSQGVYLCTASHDISDPRHTLVYKTIVIEQRAWIAADAFVSMGVTIGEGAVIGARACVFKDVAPWTVVGGNPAKFIKNREMRTE